VKKLEKVLVMDPDFHELRVRLVEIYSQLPEDMGGNPGKAGKYATYLEGKDPWFGMLARDAMLPDSLSRVDFWKEQLKAHKKDIRVSVKLGMAYLLEEDIPEAIPLLEAAIKQDPKYNLLLAQLGRYHMYQAMWHREKADEELPLAEEAYLSYLASSPPPPAHMQAWVKGHLSNIKRFSGDQEGAETIKREAFAMDPSYSKASGMPGKDLYVPPGNLYRSGDYVSFLRPF
jgi:tetratricopeptide (TPR) repeat protein